MYWRPTTYKLQGIIVALNRPCITDKWISLSNARLFQREIQLLRTMADPVARTASPYPDKSVKGPRSQQLQSGLAHSLLQDRKSEPLHAPLTS